MTQTNIDYLLQFTGPVTDRTISVAGANDGSERFDDHLSQASTVAPNEQRKPGPAARGPEPPPYNDRPSNNSACGADETCASAKRPERNDNDNSATSKTSSFESGDLSQVARDDKHAPDDVAVNDDDDQSDEKRTAEVAAVAQPIPGHASVKNSKATASANTTLPDATKSQSIVPAIGHTSNLRGKTTPNDDGAGSSQPAPADVNAKLTAADVATQTPVDLAVISTDTETSDEQVKQTKADKSAASHAKSKTAGDTKDVGTPRNKLPAGLANNGNLTDESPKAMSVEASSSAQTNPTSVDQTSDSGESSQEDSRRDGRAAARTEATAQSNQSNVALVANAAAPNAIDGSANGPTKGEKNEQNVKPVAPKGESVQASLARMSRPNGTGSGTGRAASADDGPRVDPARFVGRVAKAFQTANDRGGTLQLRLSPPELGSLRLELIVKDGVMSAALQTENANARRLLLDHLPALRDRLAEQNIRVDRFDVDVRREGTGSQADTRGSQQQQFQHQPEQPAPRRSAPMSQLGREPAVQDVLPVIPTVSDAGLNLIV